ncbi:MAG: DUF4956 domain-containing protein [Chloroflexi bacterium]|nr:DUF4956 domain-containing protein [Chloroflexota bacterium]MCC6894598.1 DUF4956 domain-containing protein [Anaerolineae bacterium]
MNGLLDLLGGFALNLAMVFIIVRFIYYPRQRDKDYVFTFFAFNTIIFFVMGLLNSTDISVGVGFGLFAIFSILRYRTDALPIREMTYLFVLIALSVLNSLLIRGQVYGEFVAVNAAVIVILYILERGWGFHYETRKSIVYERIEMIRSENWPGLMDDLRQRTGLPISRIEIGRLDFLRDTAEVRIFYDPRLLKSGAVSFVANENAMSKHDHDD